MKLKFTKGFREKLRDQVEFIAKDKPRAAKKFRTDLISQIKDVPSLPKKHRKSVYFKDESVRDLIFKGYTVVYRIVDEKDEIQVFGFVKYQEKL